MSSSIHAAEATSASVDARQWLVASACVAGALVVAPAAVQAPTVVLGALVAGALFVAVLAHPPFAAYAYLATAPVVAGINRGSLLPTLRPNEAILVVIATALLTRGIWSSRSRSQTLRVDTITLSILAMAVTSSVLPLLWMLARGLQPNSDDVLYALTFWKYLALFLVVRAAVRTARHVETALWVSLASGAVVAVLALLQVRGWFGVPQFLGHFYAPLGREMLTQIDRGTSTLGSSLATGDVMTFNLAIALAMLIRRYQPRLILVAASILFAFGALASGQFSGAIALVVGFVAVGLVTGSLAKLYLTSLPAVVVGAAAVWPTLSRRFSGFKSPEGVPLSWSGRWHNLSTYFWPRLFDRGEFLLGVRTSGRVPAPANEPWRQWVFIESGHTWLLWTGGIPLLLAFLAFLWLGLRETWRIARSRVDSVGVAAVAAFASLCVIAVVTTFDPHLTTRGVGDLLFPLLALALLAGNVTTTARTEVER